MEAGPIHFGRKPQLSVREWLVVHRSTIEELPYILVGSIDSDPRVAAMSWATTRRVSEPGWALQLLPLVISGRSVVDLLADGNLFTGFDELWFPPGLPVAQPPADAYLVAPRRLDAEEPAPIRAWLDGSRCRLGVGDGDGMNYAVRDSALGVRLGLE